MSIYRKTSIFEVIKNTDKYMQNKKKYIYIRLSTYVDSEGIGWSINFSDTGDNGYGCTRGCVMPSPSK